jgi:hypothetical protein
MSFTTIYRVVVMLAVGAVVVKGWKMYGPTTEQVKAALVNVTEIAESTWKGGSAPSDKTGSSPADKGSVAPPYGNTAQQPASADPARPPAATLTQSTANVPTSVLPNSSMPASPALITPPQAEQAANAPAPSTTSSPTKTEDRVPVLLSQLKKLGAAETKLAPWGDSGHLYRFSCRAALADSPSLTRHFESVAEEPAAAVEQVVAKVEAWRVAQRVESSIRY